MRSMNSFNLDDNWKHILQTDQKKSSFYYKIYSTLN